MVTFEVARAPLKTGCVAAIKGELGSGERVYKRQRENSRLTGALTLSGKRLIFRGFICPGFRYNRVA